MEEKLNAFLSDTEKFIDEDNYELAEYLINFILELDTKQLKALYLKTYLFEKTKQYDNALIVYDEILSISPNEIDILYDKAICLVNSSQPLAKEKALEIFLKLDPSFEETRYHISYLKSEFYIENKQYSNALEILKALNISNDDEDLLTKMSICHVGLADYSAALDIYKKLLASHPNDKIYLNNSAVCLKALGKYSKATKVYRKILEADPQNEQIKKEVERLKNLTTSSQKLLGNGLLDLHCRRYKEAVEKLSQIKPKSSYYVDALIYKGRALAKLNEHDQAISAFEQAFELDKNNKLVLLDIALSYHSANKFSEAIKYYDLLLENKDKLDKKIIETVEGDENQKGYRQLSVIASKKRTHSKTNNCDSESNKKSTSNKKQKTSATKISEATTTFFGSKQKKSKRVRNDAQKDKHHTPQAMIANPK